VTILVTVPYFGCPDLVETCVRSILHQTVTDLAVLVLGDGEEPPIHIRDDRLDVLTFRENRGPYFRQQSAIVANPFDRYAVVGADDWLEPDHFERLLAIDGDAVLTGAVWFHNLAGGVSVHRANYEVGVFATDRLRAIGGHNPAERVGQDSLLIHLLRLTGPVAGTDHPTYHRVKRHDSLMTSALTGQGTPYRNDVRRRNRVVYARCEQLGHPAAIRAYRESLVPEPIRLELAADADRISTRLGQAVAA
jgi:hypothetical protein